MKLLEPADGDLPRVLRHFEVDGSRAARELTAALEQFRRGRSGNPGFAPEVLDVMREAWSLATLEYGAGRLRTGYLLAAMSAGSMPSTTRNRGVAEAGVSPAGQNASSAAQTSAGQSWNPCRVSIRTA